MNEMNDESPLLISLDVLADFVNPLGAWHELKGEAITKAEVEACIARGEAELCDTPLIEMGEILSDERLLSARDAHVRKIAYFVVNGSDDPVDIECIDIEDIRINDGNHRLSAELINGKKAALASLGGFLDVAMDIGLYFEGAYED
ncbi:hypothetical protein [Vibrio alginolyticus]|uniref:hypothetical protein n=1 Tax=Vibrio alginolyticus TaxID=663 RepID=UPI0006CA6B35|nr:hypothetical protein [Vibrio alginolyticus]KPM98335.1 hypothetical protein AOG25_07765 [Vibrio alginolyticus]